MVEYTQYTMPTELGIVVCGLRFTFTLTRLLSNVRAKKTGVHTIKLNRVTLQFKKAVSPMEVTVEGITAEVKLLQFWNALVPIAVTELGIVMEPNTLQDWNALSRMVRVEESVTLTNFPQDRKVSVSIVAIERVMEVNPLFQNALAPIAVTVLGIARDKLVQLLKTLVPIVVTELGISRNFNKPQFLNKLLLRVLS